uniref:Uncharacterized protein n=1 Tax=Pseudomonas monteilii TaxID=76759 RepID=A0A6B7Q285_9PSED|nr:hypothetical protein [Pseudomonas monteilii]
MMLGWRWRYVTCLARADLAAVLVPLVTGRPVVTIGWR